MKAHFMEWEKLGELTEVIRACLSASDSTIKQGIIKNANIISNYHYNSSHHDLMLLAQIQQS